MVTEVYLIEEIHETVNSEEKTEEWQALVSKLELDGQREITSPEQSPIPFPHMNRYQHNVYNILCPRHTELRRFNSGSIPLRALSAIALCKEKEWFSKIEIWHDDSNPDPVAIGYVGEETYIICRWGDELRAFTELEVIAKAKLVPKIISNLRDQIRGLQNKLEHPEEEAARDLDSRWSSYR